MLSVISKTLVVRGLTPLQMSNRCILQPQSTEQSSSTIFVHTQLNVKAVLFQTIQFSISMQFSFIWPIERTLSGATTPGQSRLRSDGNEEILRIRQRSSIIGTSPSDCLVSYPGHSFGGRSAEVQSVYSTAPADWGSFQLDSNQVAEKAR